MTLITMQYLYNYSQVFFVIKMLVNLFRGFHAYC